MIKTWKKFIESISGWELVGKDMGPNYPQQKLPNSLDQKDITLLEGSDGIFYTLSDFMDLYNSLLKKTQLDPSLKDFNKQNLEILLQISNQ